MYPTDEKTLKAMKYGLDQYDMNYVGKRFQEIVTDKGLTAKVMNHTFGNLIGQTPGVTAEIIASYYNGNIVSEISSSAPITKNQKSNLNGISVFCKYLGVAKESEIIEMIGDVNPNFIYPPS